MHEHEGPDGYIRRRLLDGARDADMLAEELTKHGEHFAAGITAEEHLALLRPLVRDYTRNRVRGIVRAIEHGFQAEIDAQGGFKGSAEAKADTGRPARSSADLDRPAGGWGRAWLKEGLAVPGKGWVSTRDLTKADFEAVIARQQEIISGHKSTVRFYRWCIATMRTYKAERFGDVPLEALPDSHPVQGGKDNG